MQFGALIAAIAMSCATMSPALAQEIVPQGVYPPQDAATLDPEFAHFRSELLLAAKQRDVEKLLALCSEHIHLDFGGGAGREEFGRRLAEPETELWADLIDVLEHGSLLKDGQYFAPYWFAMPVEGDYDPFTTAFVPAWEAPVFKGPSAQSPRVGAVSYGFVALREPFVLWQAGAFQGVTMADGRDGFMRTDSLRSVVGYRAGFEREADGWRMTFFIAGD